MSEEARDLISQLVIRNPLTRLGYGGASEIKKHDFFKDLDWNAFKKRQSDGYFKGIYPTEREKKLIKLRKKGDAQNAYEELQEGSGVAGHVS